MRRFSITTDIRAPAARVWQVMSDIDRWNQWTPSITSINRPDDDSFAPGTRVVIRQPKFPPATWTITEVEPGRSFSWVSGAPGVRVTACHRIEPVAEGSRATLSLELDGVLGGIFGALTRRVTERYMAFEARGLAARSEDPEFRHSGLVP